MSAQISFLDGTYTLIHIPLDLYTTFLQPILRVLVPQTARLHLGADFKPDVDELDGLSEENQHGFLNISVTPLEASIVCHTSWAKEVFEPVINSLPAQKAKTVSVFTDSYMVLSVIGAGLDAATRVLELSSPLALAGIPIFFITTYYSDFILAPTRERQNVIAALCEKGFEMSENQSNSITSPTYSRKNSESHHSASPPSTPPPSTDNELQLRTFDLLHKRSVSPYVDEDLELVQCSGREISQLADAYGHRSSISRHTVTDNRQSWIENVDTKLYASLISVLISQPRFISITLAHEDPPSLLMDKNLLGLFSDSLVGDMDNILIPIFLDLLNLSSEVTGIVCGVSGRLVDEMKMTATSELSYLSTARAGVVILPEEQSTRALGILKPLLQKDE
ncbi:hypothetical protein H634G_01914 [Metarhizium anisopliae BRIP 53293]|uniref:CASTOR ACT domain-containing protein n=1 Tax=Metarhizium anisopliae BRIP 53293 TaxID=1291518 RepID=A0A0D9P938_METAN|nr:hypothetical protein H634G_01914 [Metarhizium anisopliae BRIP 53293]KJK93411.1 hypothetical protein H633G_02612 [Metarhizium anisopliae BRIP 53284]